MKTWWGLLPCDPKMLWVIRLGIPYMVELGLFADPSFCVFTRSRPRFSGTEHPFLEVSVALPARDEITFGTCDSLLIAVVLAMGFARFRAM